jgi:hypothetical protein
MVVRLYNGIQKAEKVKSHFLRVGMGECWGLYVTQIQAQIQDTPHLEILV